jgi:hypothetical protein
VATIFGSFSSARPLYDATAALTHPPAAAGLPGRRRYRCRYDTLRYSSSDPLSDLRGNFSGAYVVGGILLVVRRITRYHLIAFIASLLLASFALNYSGRLTFVASRHGAVHALPSMFCDLSLNYSGVTISYCTCESEIVGEQGGAYGEWHFDHYFDASRANDSRELIEWNSSGRGNGAVATRESHCSVSYPAIAVLLLLTVSIKFTINWWRAKNLGRRLGFPVDPLGKS